MPHENCASSIGCDVHGHRGLGHFVGLVHRRKAAPLAKRASVARHFSSICVTAGIQNAGRSIRSLVLVLSNTAHPALMANSLWRVSSTRTLAASLAYSKIG